MMMVEILVEIRIVRVVERLFGWGDGFHVIFIIFQNLKTYKYF